MATTPFPCCSHGWIPGIWCIVWCETHPSPFWDICLDLLLVLFLWLQPVTHIHVFRLVYRTATFYSHFVLLLIFQCAEEFAFDYLETSSGGFSHCSLSFDDSYKLCILDQGVVSMSASILFFGLESWFLPAWGGPFFSKKFGF